MSGGWGDFIEYTFYIRESGKNQRFRRAPQHVGNYSALIHSLTAETTYDIMGVGLPIGEAEKVAIGELVSSNHTVVMAAAENLSSTGAFEFGVRYFAQSCITLWLTRTQGILL